MSEIYRINEKRPTFPCWLWIHDGYFDSAVEENKWYRPAEFQFNRAVAHATHWSPDAPKPPTQKPGSVMDEAAQDQQESAMVADCVKNLAEHFDSVTILCSRHDGSRGTRTIAKGSGNWHTQYGIVREWLLNRDATIQLEARPEVGPGS